MLTGNPNWSLLHFKSSLPSSHPSFPAWNVRLHDASISPTPDLWLSLQLAGSLLVFWFLPNSFQMLLLPENHRDCSSVHPAIPWPSILPLLLLSQDPWLSLFGGMPSLSSSRAGFCSLSCSPQHLAGASVPRPQHALSCSQWHSACALCGARSTEYAERVSGGVCSPPPESSSHQEHPCDVSPSHPP